MDTIFGNVAGNRLLALSQHIFALKIPCFRLFLSRFETELRAPSLSLSLALALDLFLSLAIFSAPVSFSGSLPLFSL